MRKINDYVLEGLKVNSKSKFYRLSKTPEEFFEKYKDEFELTQTNKESAENFTFVFKKESEIGKIIFDFIDADQSSIDYISNILGEGHDIKFMMNKNQNMYTIIYENKKYDCFIKLFVIKTIYDSIVLSPFQEVNERIKEYLIKIVESIIKL